MKTFRIVSIGFVLSLCALFLATSPMARERVQAAGLSRTGEIFDVRTPGLSFSPATVRIKVGDTVRWTIDMGHDAESDQSANGAPLFKFPVVDAPTARFSYTFDQPGTYTYRCNPHVNEGMVGTIIVEAIAQPTLSCTGCKPVMYLPLIRR